MEEVESEPCHVGLVILVMEFLEEGGYTQMFHFTGALTLRTGDSMLRYAHGDQIPVILNARHFNALFTK